MKWKAISMVKVDFHKKVLSGDDTQAIERLLRTFEDIDNLHVEKGGINFYIWAGEKVEYSPLEKLKAKLEELNYSDFEISAYEYTESGNDYHYNSKI